MLIDMNGNLKKIPKKNKQNEKIAPHDLVIKISELLKDNTDSFFVFFTNQNLSYDIKKCTRDEMSKFIDLMQTDKLKLTIYDCLDAYFYEEDYQTIESNEINKQQEFIEKFIKEYINKDNDDKED